MEPGCISLGLGCVNLFINSKSLLFNAKQRGMSTELEPRVVNLTSSLHGECEIAIKQSILDITSKFCLEWILCDLI